MRGYRFMSWARAAREHIICRCWTASPIGICDAHRSRDGDGRWKPEELNVVVSHEHDVAALAFVAVPGGILVGVKPGIFPDPIALDYLGNRAAPLSTKPDFLSLLN